MAIPSVAMVLPTGTAERLEWNTEFEETLAEIYPDGHPTTQNIFDNPIRLKTMQLHIQTGQAERELAGETIMVLQLQKYVHMEGNRGLGVFGFEDKWQSTPLERRREIALESIYTTCSRSNFHETRLLCPEMTQENLSQEFIPLLKSFTTRDVSQLETPILFPNDKFEDYIRPPAGYEAELEPYTRFKRLQRSYCLLLTIGHMQDLFHYGKTVPMQQLKMLRTRKEDKMTEEERTANQELKEITSYVLGRRHPLGGLRARLKEEHKGAIGVSVCFYRCCPKSHPEQAAGTKMMACTRCNKNGIRVTYCSKECQTRDWKEGHKRICGANINTVGETKAPLTTPFGPMSEADRSYMSTGIPKAVPPFVHSSALRGQIAMLLETRDMDYWLIDPANLSRIVGFVCYDSIENHLKKTQFHIARRRAMISGNRNAVYTMYRVIISVAPRLGFPLPAVGEQLYREYGVRIKGEGDDKNRLDPLPDDQEYFLLGEYFKTIPPMDPKENFLA